jgi:hypothetical protein
MAMFIREEVEQQERLEAAGYQRGGCCELYNPYSRRHSSFLLPKCRQRNSPVWGD